MRHPAAQQTLSSALSDVRQAAKLLKRAGAKFAAAGEEWHAGNCRRLGSDLLAVADQVESQDRSTRAVLEGEAAERQVLQRLKAEGRIRVEAGNG